MNQLFWEQYTNHLFTKEYNINNIIHSVSPIERSFLRDLKDKNIFHPFCNFGMNTFVLEDMGGMVTALDYNQHAIDVANKYKEKIKSNVNFICGNFFDYQPDKLYDVIYASYGVLDWVSDINLFISKVNSLLKVGGKFILVEFHSDFFYEKFSSMGKEIVGTNGFKIKTNFKHRVGTSSKSLLGDGYDTQEDIVIEPHLHNTSEFINTAKSVGFQIDRLEYFDYINFKMGNDIQLGPNQYRNKNLKEGQRMSFGLILNKTM